DGDGGFPVTIEHTFGSTVIPAAPERIVTLSTSEHDYVLALGEQPVAVRPNSPTQPFAVWPWADDLVVGDDPVLVDVPELNIEQIASLAPDLIFMIDGFIEADTYETLSQIAPVVVRPEGVAPGEVPWRNIQRLVGRALDRSDEAEQIIADVEGRFAEVRSAHPEFVGAEASIAFIRPDGALGSFRIDDIAYEFMAELGFSAPQALVDLGSATNSLGPERIDLLDADVVLWSLDGSTIDTLRSLPTWPIALPAAQERRELLLDPITVTALVESSPLAIDFLLDRLVDDLAAAVDGDPETIADSAVPLYEVDTDGPTPEERAAMDAWEIVLGPDVPVDGRRPHIEDFDELRPTLVAAIEATEAAGGRPITSTRAVIEGDVATVSFDTELDGEAITDLPAELMLIDGVWVASREQVCSYLVFVGVECPT
ncbi:MAG: ABC transporter substrate-binding protein, partial [Actinomycetota bacterium]